MHSYDLVSLENTKRTLIFIKFDVFCVACLSAQDAESVDRRSKRQSKLETVNNNAKVLSEMLAHYKLESATETELDVMKVGQISLRKL